MVKINNYFSGPSFDAGVAHLSARFLNGLQLFEKSPIFVRHLDEQRRVGNLFPPNLADGLKKTENLFVVSQNVDIQTVGTIMLKLPINLTKHNLMHFCCHLATWVAVMRCQMKPTISFCKPFDHR
jgi:hypothetical protein